MLHIDEHRPTPAGHPVREEIYHVCQVHKDLADHEDPLVFHGLMRDAFIILVHHAGGKHAELIDVRVLRTFGEILDAGKKPLPEAYHVILRGLAVRV